MDVTLLGMVTEVKLVHPWYLQPAVTQYILIKTVER